MATQKKTPIKNNRRKSNTQPSNLKKHLGVFLGVCLMVFLVALGYSLGKNDNTVSTAPVGLLKQPAVSSQTPSTTQTVQAVETNLSKSAPLKQESKKAPTPLAQTQSKPEAVLKVVKSDHTMLAYRGAKPKLVMIIDDVTSAKQLAQINALPLKLTPSLFPPYELSKSNHTLAQGLKHYMIHLPMESGKAYDKQYGTLRVSDSEDTMNARAKELRKLFPTARYINNHTGSVFTKNEDAMKRLYRALKKEGFVFIDSRTTAKSTVQKIAHDFGDAYVARDVFIDNKRTIPSIHAQLKQAVKDAKKNGYAIAIGHPYPVTMKALASAKEILDEVDVVYIDDIYRKNK